MLYEKYHSIYDRAFEYFQTFSDKDSEGLRDMFSDDVILHDWDIIANGIDEVVQAKKRKKKKWKGGRKRYVDVRKNEKKI